MNTFEKIFLSANIICCVGTLLQIYQVILNKNILYGYDLVGSLLTLIAVVLFNVGFYMVKQKLSVAFGMVTVMYWLFVSIFKIIF